LSAATYTLAAASSTPRGTFVTIALPLAAKGIPCTPVRPNSKQAFLPNFPATATTDVNQLLAWDVQYPNHNAACVARAEVGGIWVLEVDSPNVVERVRGETGHDLNALQTFRVRSRPGRGHFYFRQTPASMAMGNLSQTYVVGQDWSARVHHQYVVAPGSIHPDTGQPYKALNDLQPIEAPQWLIDWLISQKITKSGTDKPEAPRNANGLVPHGAIHGWLVSQGGRLRQNGLETDEIEIVLLRQAHAECEEPLDDAKIVQVARSMGNYEKGTPWQNIVALNQQPDKIAGPTAPTVDDDDEPEENLGDTQDEFPRCPIFPGALTELARSMFPSLPLDFKQWGMIARWGLLRSGIDTFGIEKHLQPRFYSVLVSKPNRGKTASINETRNAFEIIYGMMKSATGTKLRVCGEPESIPSVDSGQFFSDEFARMVKASKAAYEKGECADLAGKMMLDPDELSDVFEKGRVTQGRVSTMFIELLKLHSGNRTGSGTKKDGKSAVTNAHLSILAGTTVRKYPMLWTGTGGGADGLVSRFIPITTNNPPVPPVPLPSDFVTAEKMYVRLTRLAELPGQTVMLDEEASKMLTDWWGSFDSGMESATRVLETIKQLLIVLAVTNLPENHQGNTVTVDADLMTYAIQFGEYVIAVRDRLNPSDSWSHVQALENSIIDWVRKHASKAEPKTMNDVRRGVQPHRVPGGLGAFKMAWRNCVETDVLKFRQKGHKGGGKYSL
jgi:Bifunctional DNA primase/polymerase, N-terminal